jgi:hypothetical protein
MCVNVSVVMRVVVNVRAMKEVLNVYPTGTDRDTKVEV